MTDRDLFFATLRMYELTDGQPKALVLDAATDVDALVESLFANLV